MKNIMIKHLLDTRMRNTSVPKIPSYSFRGMNDKLPSLHSNDHVASLPPQKVYTGTKMIGIATLHKSNAVPVFSEQEAVDISNMRR